MRLDGMMSYRLLNIDPDLIWGSYGIAQWCDALNKVWTYGVMFIKVAQEFFVRDICPLLQQNIFPETKSCPINPSNFGAPFTNID